MNIKKLNSIPENPMNACPHCGKYNCDGFSWAITKVKELTEVE